MTPAHYGYLCNPPVGESCPPIPRTIEGNSVGFDTTTSWTVPEGITGVDVLVVGGGGGGGYDGGGGGGGGEVVEQRGVSVTPGESIPIVIGLGGSGGFSKNPSEKMGLPGQSSRFGSIVAVGGKGGDSGSAGGTGSGGISGSNLAG